MDQYGKSYVQCAPFDSKGFYVINKSLEEEEEEEEEEEKKALLGKGSLVKQGCSDDHKRPDENVQRLSDGVTENKENEKVEKGPRKSVTLPEMGEVRKKEEEKKEPSVRLHYPTRSRTVKCRTSSPSSSQNADWRRKSLVMLKQGYTGEGGSEKFREALRKDSVNEVHPGWEKIKKFSKVVG